MSFSLVSIIGVLASRQVPSDTIGKYMDTETTNSNRVRLQESDSFE